MPHKACSFKYITQDRLHEAVSFLCKRQHTHNLKYLLYYYWSINKATTTKYCWIQYTNRAVTDFEKCSKHEVFKTGSFWYYAAITLSKIRNRYGRWLKITTDWEFDTSAWKAHAIIIILPFVMREELIVTSVCCHDQLVTAEVTSPIFASSVYINANKQPASP